MKKTILMITVLILLPMKAFSRQLDQVECLALGTILAPMMGTISSNPSVEELKKQKKMNKNTKHGKTYTMKIIANLIGLKCVNF